MITKSLFVLSTAMLVLFSCKAKRESMEKHAEVTSKLRTYQTDDFFKENYTDSLFTDYIELSYKEYQKK